MSSAASASPRVSEVEMWTVQQVFEYFKQLSLHDVAEVVQSQGVDGKTLMNMSSSGFQAFPENKRKLIHFIMKNIKSEKNATITIMKAVLHNLQGISVPTPSPDEDYYIYFEDPTSKVDDKDSKCTQNNLSHKEDMQNNQYEGFYDSYIQPDACTPMESIERPQCAPPLLPKLQFTPPELPPRPGTQNNLSDKEDMQNNQYEGFSDPYVQPDVCTPMENIEQTQCAPLPLHPKRQSTPPEPPPRPRLHIPLSSVHQPLTKPQVQTVSCTALASCGLNMAMNPVHRSQDSSDLVRKVFWFTNCSNREKAEKAVKEKGLDGAFLIRKSTFGSSEQPYSLVVFNNGTVHNVKIRYISESKEYALGSEKANEERYDSIEEIVRFHEKDPLLLIPARQDIHPQPSVLLKHPVMLK